MHTLGLVLGVVGVALLGNPVLANPRSAGMEGSYLGVTLDGNNVDSGLRSLVRTNSAAGWLGDQLTPRSNAASSSSPHANERQIQGRVDLQDSPVSIRGTVVIGNEVEAVLPTVTYDVPVGRAANVFAGAGYAIVRPGEQTLLGDRNGLVITAGAETAINRNIVIYGDVRYRPVNTPGEEPVRAQLGLGHRF
ncbi:hypothetical protein ACQ4M4_16085 [Leptolyngbya sp. AN02str]|uniref:hypothetical protein n=1 Tax=Leptolyngbya sp. AN02str TaxID=3423363 RepID=UPI003D310719